MRRTLCTRSLLSLLLVFAVSASVASAAVQNRLASAISGETRVAIPNSVHPRAKLANDLGPAAGDMKLEGMTLRFSLTAAQEAALDQLLIDQQDPASSRYHQWLTPAQYGAQFGLSAADIAKVTAWLGAQGFTVTEIAPSSTYVRFDGTVAQAQTAFATSIHSLSRDGQTYFANMTDTALPAALSGVVGGITGLNNFKLKSRARTSVVPDTAVPRFTSSISGSHYVAPGDFYTIYNETPLINSSITGAGVGTGTKCLSVSGNPCGDIAIMGQVDISLADIAAFRAASGLAANVPTIKLYGTDPGGAQCASTCYPSQGDVAESSLDVEWAGATAPGASILFVNSTNVVDTSLTAAITYNVAPIVSISYGNCESAWGSTEMTKLNQLMKQGNAQGITILGPAGDSGATDCDGSDASATQGLAVDFPASSPYATAVGGTMFNDGTATGATSYWNTNSTSTTSNAGSALSYIPEAVWNEDVTGATFAGGGGGISNFFTKPAWQIGTPADASRDVPDVALNSAASHEGYLYCVNGSCTASTFRDANSNLTVGGGTSFATPSFAGILALVEQKVGSRIGNANPMIYALANNSSYYASVFHDVTTGSNKNLCTAGTPNCPNGGTIGYSAAAGYDLATGWGSVNALNLVNAWGAIPALSSGTPGSGIATTTVSASPTAVVSGASVTLTAALTGVSVSSSNPLVTAAGVTPTGTVQFLINNVVVGSPVTLSGGVATYTFATSCSTLGQQVITASYSGDVNYAGSKGAGISLNGSSSVTPTLVQVSSGTCPDFTVTPASTTVTTTTGTPTVAVTIAPVNGFTGTVVFSATAVENTNYAPSLSFSPASLTTSGTTTLTLGGITAEMRKPLLPGERNSGTMLAKQGNHRLPWYGGSGIAVASLIFLVLPRRRRLGGLLLVLLSIAAIGGTTGCGSAKNGTITGTAASSQAGTYVVTITGTYTSTASVVTSHSTTITFIVQ